MGRKIYMIDAGVAGTEKAVADYLASLGRNVEEIDKLFLTHSHPDHIGGAAAIKKLSGCTVYASAAERSWIEDIEQQFKERPIPNFHSLLNESVTIDTEVREEDVVLCEEGISLKVLETPGHSHGSLSFLFQQERALFTGDAVPVPGDIPIYISPEWSEQSLRKILALENIDLYLSAWDEIQGPEDGRKSLFLALDKQANIDKAVRQVLRLYPEVSLEVQFKEVCRLLKLETLEGNPLFRKSVSFHLQEVSNGNE